MLQNFSRLSNDLALDLRKVVKRFGDFTAVNELNLQVPTGSCVGLLGPNGAGKSTTMRMLTAQAIATSGELTVLGYRLPGESKKARSLCGVVPQLDNLDETLSVEDNLRVFAHLYRVPRSKRAEAIDRALAIARLSDRRKTRIDRLSGGMRRRLLIARALVHHPRLVLLDEPTVGLDPQVRQELWALIEQLRSEGTSILMSTHYIEEAERLCDHVTIVAKGKDVASGKSDDLVRKYAGENAWEIFGSPDELEQVELEAQKVGRATRRTGTSVSVLGGSETLAGYEARSQRRSANLEDVFVLLTGEEIA